MMIKLLNLSNQKSGWDDECWNEGKTGKTLQFITEDEKEKKRERTSLFDAGGEYREAGLAKDSMLHHIESVQLY
jgi:hypothetical protein